MARPEDHVSLYAMSFMQTTGKRHFIDVQTHYYIQIEHPALCDLLAPLLELQADVQKKAILRLDYDGLAKPKIASTALSSTNKK